MTINKKSAGNKLTIELEGKLDTGTSPELSKVLNSSLDGVNELVFDFEKLFYISSAGIRVLLTAQKTMKTQGTMKVKNVSDAVMEVFSITGVSRILDID